MQFSLKSFAFLILLLFASSGSLMARKKSAAKSDDATWIPAEAACGQCQFNMKAKGCSLAVQINGRALWVKGADIDGFGDAHADDGFCNAIRPVRVQGRIRHGKFIATAFELQPPRPQLIICQ